MSDRIPCTNPRCRRTADASKLEPGTEIICAKCCKGLPPGMWKRFRMAKARFLKVERRCRVRLARGDLDPQLADRVCRAAWGRTWAAWEAIRATFTSERPEGIAGFLAEIGLER